MSKASIAITRLIRGGALVSAVGILSLLTSCSQDGDDSGAAPPKKVFSGISGHWDQSQIPISMQCGACHPDQFRSWAESDHAWAFRSLNPKWDAEAFHGHKLKAHGTTLSFQTDDKQQRSILDVPTGKAWTAKWAVGRTPLVQYIVPAEDKGYHTPSAAWDVLKHEWFDMFGNDSRQPGDWGHWTGRGMNWNSQCAWCHMSGFQKNYDLNKHTYHSDWKEPGVSCIQCHGPLLKHPEKGTGCMISTKTKPDAKQIRDNCATCHARRHEFDHDFAIGDKFDDHFLLILPTQPGVFWPNGMQRDEDYCETGLRLSRMGKAGVTCIDCHDPHSGTLKLPQEDNSLCLRCHGNGTKVNGIAAPVIDIAKHTPCPQGSKGARCVECHMPESNYMARDPRRDHSFNSPDPQMSVELGIPNACTMCHRNKTDLQAAEDVRKYYGDKPKMAAYRDRTRAVQMAYDNKPGAREALLKALAKEENGAWKATLLDLLASYPADEAIIRAAKDAASEEEPLARVAAARILGSAGNAAAEPLLHDPIRAVRIQAAWELRDKLDRNTTAFKELETAAKHQADQPVGAMKLAELARLQGNYDIADSWYRKACEWDATSAAVHRDYAIFLSTCGRTKDALKYMQKATSLDQDDASLWYLLGLGFVETEQNQNALLAFSQAITLDPAYTRARYNRALLHNQMGQWQEALKDLDACLQAEPAQPDFLYVQATIYLEHGDRRKAAVKAREALRISPQYDRARQMLQYLGERP